MAPIPLSCVQLGLVYSMNRVLAEEDRERFLVALANIVAGMPQPVGDGEFWRIAKDLQKELWKPPPTERSWVNADSRRRVGEPLP